jgi:predicted Zn-dependent protease
MKNTPVSIIRLLPTSLFILLLISMTVLAKSAVQKEKADRAKAAMSSGDFAEAASLYAELVRELPTLPGLKMNLGMACFNGGRFNEAVKYLALAVQGDPALTQAWLFLAAAQLEIGHPQEALAAAQKYLKEKPGEPNGLQILGDALLRTEQYSRSIGAFEQVAQKMPDSPRAWYGLGRSYEGLAGQAFAKLEKAAPESGYWFALIADSRVAQKQFSSAFYFYRKALEKQPKLRGIHMAISRVYRLTDHPDWAENEVQRELELGEPSCDKEPLVCDFLAGRSQKVVEKTLTQSSPECYYWQAQACNLLALAAFSKLEQLPSSLEAHELRAEIHRNQGRHWESVKEWEQALALAPDDPRLKRELALSLYLKRDYDAAKALIDELLKKDPESGELNYLAGDILLYQQKVEPAVPFLQKAVKLSPELTGAHSALGRAYMDLGETEKAIPHLKLALRSDEDGSLHFQLSRAYQKTGREQLARETLAKYEEITKSKKNEEKKLLEEMKITPP